MTKNGMCEVPKRKRNTKFRFDKRTNIQRIFGYCPRCGKWFRYVTVHMDPVPLLDEVYWNYFVDCDDCAFSQIIEKLYAYEKSGYTPEEVNSRRMVHSPLTVGDMVYHIRTDESKPYIEEGRVGLVKLSYLMDNGTGWRDSWELQVDNYGVTTFPSKEEAEKVLEEMKQNVT